MKGISHSSNQPRWAIIAIELQCLANCNFANCRACHNVTSPRCIVFISKALLILAKHSLIHEIDAPQKLRIAWMGAHVVENRVYFYPSHPDLSLIGRLFHPLPRLIGVAKARFRSGNEVGGGTMLFAG